MRPAGLSHIDLETEEVTTIGNGVWGGPQMEGYVEADCGEWDDKWKVE